MLLSWENTGRNPAYDIKQEVGWEIQKHDCNMISVLLLIFVRQRRKIRSAFREKLWTMRGAELSVRHLMFLFFKLTFFRIHPNCFATIIPGSTTDWAQQHLQEPQIWRWFSAPHISSPSLKHRHRHLPRMFICTGMVITELTSAEFSRELCIMPQRKETLDVSFILESNASKARNYS